MIGYLKSINRVFLKCRERKRKKKKETKRETK